MYRAVYDIMQDEAQGQTATVNRPSSYTPTRHTHTSWPPTLTTRAHTRTCAKDTRALTSLTSQVLIKMLFPSLLYIVLSGPSAISVMRYPQLRCTPTALSRMEQTQRTSRGEGDLVIRLNHRLSQMLVLTDRIQWYLNSTVQPERRAKKIKCITTTKNIYKCTYKSPFLELLRR